jgi:hypothetical protein
MMAGVHMCCISALYNPPPDGCRWKRLEPCPPSSTCNSKRLSDESDDRASRCGLFLKATTLQCGQDPRVRLKASCDPSECQRQW